MAAAKSKKKDQPGVLASLPATRPSRLSRRGRDAADEPSRALPKKPPAPPLKDPVSAKVAPARKTAPKKDPVTPKPSAPKATPTVKAAPSAAPAAKRAPRKAAPKKDPVSRGSAPVRSTPAKAATTPIAAVPDAPPTAKPRRPKAVRSTTPALDEPIARAKARSDDEPSERSGAPIAQAPSGTELVSTVVQAAGELVSIGATLGGQIVRRALERLPKP